MSKVEILNELNEIKALTCNMEADKGRKCKRFFEIIHSIRMTVDIINEILKRIEKIENEINNLKQN